MNGKETPASLGFYMPAEWERHAGTWLAWPYDETTFPDRVPQAENVFVEMIGAIADKETVRLLVVDDAMRHRTGTLAKKAGVDTAKIDFRVTQFTDVWTRDYGPIVLQSDHGKRQGWVKWIYNGYGKADDPYYAPLLVDNDVFDHINLPGQKFEPGIVLEGGSIEVNGEGVCLTTKQCLLNPNRNPGLSKAGMEQYLHDYLGVTKTIWLRQGLANDHTDGHIDEIARFVGPHTIVCAYEDDEADENFKILDNNYRVLKNASDANGKSFEVIKLPMPHMQYDDGTKAPVSYCNFYIANDVVLAATFNDPNDAKALEILQSLFPTRKVVGIDCSDVIYGGGAIHCMTMQEPLT